MADSSGAHFLVNAWYNKAVWLYLLWPISLLFRALAALRRVCYRSGLFTSWKAPVPVVVVGNITAGGTGKTPFVVSLVRELNARGFNPGIVSRGYGSNALSYPFHVTPDSGVREAGDEPLLLATRTNVPVVIGANRVEAVQSLLKHHVCDVVVCDDGLQHYALQRDIEVAVVDGQRLFGNQLFLPAGPLREPVCRIEDCDFIVTNGVAATPVSTSVPIFSMQLQPVGFERIQTEDQSQLPLDLSRWSEPFHVHALAGIGNPARFFNALRGMGFTVIEHAFDDHHEYCADDLVFADSLPVVMTEKDAVKIRQLSGIERERLWYLPVDAVIDTDIFSAIAKRIED